MVRKLKKSTHEAELIEVFARYGNGYLGGSTADKRAWEDMERWKIESEKFRLFCEDRLSETDYALIFGERSQWPPEGVDWFSVLKKRDKLFRDFEELTRGD